MKLVAFCGPAGVGKSTASKYFIARGYVKLSFADPLRSMLAVLTDVYDRYDERKLEPREELCGKSVRHALQTLGTDWARNLIGEDIWLRQFERRVAANPEIRFVVDDCRFDNEAELVRKLGGTVVKLHRPGFSHNASHASEAGVSPGFIDAEISATTPEQLWDSLDSLTARIPRT